MFNALLKSTFYTLVTIACFTTHLANACTIFSCARNGKVFAAANEDDYTPFTWVWYNPPTKDRYGSVCFGAPDMQVAAAMNEYGLFFDAAAASYDLNKLNQKNPYKGFLLWEVVPAQDIHILRNPSQGGDNPWYKASNASSLVTPEWVFDMPGALKTW